MDNKSQRLTQCICRYSESSKTRLRAYCGCAVILYEPRRDLQTDGGIVLGQVANYMKVHGKRFGYITTYEATVFFKQAPAPRGNGTVLYHSRVISHATPSRNVGSGPLSGNVSLRECMLFIACASSENSDYANHETIWTETWESNKSRSAAPGPHDGRIGGGQGGGKSTPFYSRPATSNCAFRTLSPQVATSSPLS